MINYAGFADIILVMTDYESYTAHTDDELVACFKKGEIESFSEMYRRYNSRIFNFVRKYLNNSARCEDITQEIFVRIYRNLHSFRGGCKLSTWFYKIATNTCINEIKKKQVKTISLFAKFRNTGGDERELEEMIQAPSPGPEEQLEDEMLRQRIYSCVEKLPDKYREAFILYELQDLKYEEIAEILSIPVGTVKFRIHSARQKLREMLQKFITQEQK